MKSPLFFTKLVARQLAMICLLAGSVLFLTSCATTPAPGGGVFKFTILHYPQPEPVDTWEFDPAQSSNPEGAALNIVHSMQHDNVNRWLAAWDDAERPKLSSVEKETLLKKWDLLKTGKVYMLGRVVAGGDLVMELNVVSASHGTQKVQLPMKRENGQWWLTAMEPDSEYLNWEKSANTILAPADPLAFRTYLNNVNLAKAK